MASPAGRAVHQLVGSLAPGDPLAEHALAIQGRLRASGFGSDLFAATVHPRWARLARPLWEYRQVSSARTACLFHFCGGAPARLLHAAPDRIALAHYGLGEAEELLGYDAGPVRRRHQARRELAAFAERAELALAASERARRELDRLGFPRTALLPLRPDRGRPAAVPAPVLARMLADRRLNVLFAGRIAPHERIEELLRLFAVLQRFVRPDCRLLVVGDTGANRRYYAALTRMADELRLEEVHFTGLLDRGDLEACYRSASVFLSLGEERDGARLLEAMAAGVPVLARDSGAAAELMRGGGVLLGGARLEETAELVALAGAEGPLRSAALDSQRRALERLGRDDPTEGLLAGLGPLLERTG